MPAPAIESKSANRKQERSPSASRLTLVSELPTRNPELNTTGKLTHPARQSAIPNPQSAIRNPRSAFTLVEVLVAMAVTLILMGIVVTIFGVLGDNVSGTRGLMEMSEQLRGVKQRLQADLAGITVTTLPPRRPERDQGYLEIIEGPVGRIEGTGANAAMRQAVTVQVLHPDENTTGSDTTVGDNDDILMFTTRSSGEPFVGRFGITTLQSPVAEIAWFLRGTTLYRRVLLVKPSVTSQLPSTTPSFYANYDVSVHPEGGNYDLTPNPAANVRIVANSLGDLTKRENRFAHIPLQRGVTLFGWPHESRIWGVFTNASNVEHYGRLGLPTLQECSDPNWPTFLNANATPPYDTIVTDNKLTTSNGNDEFDAWSSFKTANGSPNPWNQVDRTTGILSYYAAGPRVGEDVILTHVLQFDVKVWDPLAPVFTVNAALDSSNANWLVGPSDANGTMVIMPGDPGYPTALQKWLDQGSLPAFAARGAYVDLNYAQDNSYSAFSGPGNSFSGLTPLKSGLTATTAYPAAIYDTWSTHYEHDGIDQDNDGRVDEGVDGFESDTTANGVDDAGEQEAPPPYAAPLRGIQIRIRAFEPDSRQIREVTIVQEFLPE